MSNATKKTTKKSATPSYRTEALQDGVKVTVSTRILAASANAGADGITAGEAKNAIALSHDCVVTCKQLAGCPANRNQGKLPYEPALLEAVTYPAEGGGQTAMHFVLTEAGRNALDLFVAEGRQVRKQGAKAGGATAKVKAEGAKPKVVSW